MDAHLTADIPFPHRPGIYAIWFIAEKTRVYIGSAVSLRNRKERHIWELNKGIHGNQKLQRLYDKHGINNFRFEILEAVDEVNTLIGREQFWIDSIKTEVDEGVMLNLCFVAGSVLGIKRTDETRKKLSIANKGQKPTQANIEAVRRANTGRKITDAERRKRSISSKSRPLSEAFLAASRSPETNKKRAVGISVAKKGKPLPQATVAAAWTPEARAKRKTTRAKNKKETPFHFCTIVGCTRKYVARGYCGHHYHQLITKQKQNRKNKVDDCMSIEGEFMTYKILGMQPSATADGRVSLVIQLSGMAEPIAILLDKPMIDSMRMMLSAIEVFLSQSVGHG